ncbi:hypothetical protein Tco_0732557 [Tanacetum coccineum]
MFASEIEYSELERYLSNLSDFDVVWSKLLADSSMSNIFTDSSMSNILTDSPVSDTLTDSSMSKILVDSYQ